MLLQLLKFKKEVNTLYLQNKLISSISTTLEMSSRSITNTLYRIKQKNKAILPTLQLKLGRPTKIIKRIKTIINSTRPLKACWPRKRNGWLSTPCNFAQAINEPENDTAPIKAPNKVTINTTMSCGLLPNNSTAAMAAAVPPIPL